MSGIIGLTAALVIEQIYRELEVDTSDATRYYSGEFNMKAIALAWLHAANQVQGLVRRSDIQGFVVYATSLDINSSLQVTKPEEYYTPISAYVGTKPVIISPAGQLLDREYWIDNAGAAAITMVDAGSVLQLRGDVTASDTLSLCYQRRIHPPALVADLAFTSASTIVPEATASDIAYRANVYSGAKLFELAASHALIVQSNDAAELTLTTTAGFTDSSSESVVFALPELPADYLDAMIAHTCLYLMNGEDLQGWRERSQRVNSLPRLHRPSTPRARERGLFDADSR